MALMVRNFRSLTVLTGPKTPVFGLATRVQCRESASDAEGSHLAHTMPLGTRWHPRNIQNSQCEFLDES